MLVGVFMGGFMSKPTCKIDHIVKSGESAYQIVKTECRFSNDEAAQVAFDWAASAGIEVYDLTGWVKFAQGKIDSLRKMSLTDATEKVVENVANELGVPVSDAPRNLKFVPLEAGDRLTMEVHKMADGRLMVVNMPHDEPIKETPPVKKILGCFSGDTFLRLQDGRTITFEDYAAKYKDDSERPAVACYDPNGKGVIYQRPTKVLVHPESEHESMIDLQCLNEKGIPLNTPLKVTAFHPFMVGIDQYVRTGDLLDGVGLVTLDDSSCFFNEGLTGPGETQSAVYNLSFTTENGESTPVFFVSSDGNTWIGVHNIDTKT